MTCSTSNPSRSGGGTTHYRIIGTDINLLCSDIDEQVANFLVNIQVDPDLVPIIQDCYTADLAEKLGHNRPSERGRIEAALKAIDEQEARSLRLFAAGKISEDVWDNLWAEWQDRRCTLKESLVSAKQEKQYHIAHLDDALHIIAKIGVLFRCTVPDYSGTVSTQQREELWDKYFTVAPERQRQSVEQSKIVKRA